ncbi:zinc finger protein 675 [Biomphalaria glabrata]|nr:zinc finger protein 675 [Biomphalaria glabrata]
MPLICFICESEFSDSLALKKHCLIHTFDNPNSCSLCDYSCCDSKLLELHFSNKHKKNENFVANTLSRRQWEEKNLFRCLETNTVKCEINNKLDRRYCIAASIDYLPPEQSLHQLNCDFSLNGSNSGDIINGICERQKENNRCQTNSNKINTLSLVTDNGKLEDLNTYKLKDKVKNEEGCGANVTEDVTTLSHLSNQLYSCEECAFKASSKKELNSHQKKHLQGIIYHCHHCDYISNQKGTLTRHLRVHSEFKQFKCHICEFSTRHKSTLKTHTKVHFDIRDHQCDLCGKKFLTKQNLDAHCLIHTGQRPHECSVCNKTFIQSQHLKTHFKKKHSDYI